MPVHPVRNYDELSNCLQFRRDALGMAANVPASPRIDSMNGAASNVSGKLTAYHADWIVLTDGHDDLWVPSGKRG